MSTVYLGYMTLLLLQGQKSVRKAPLPFRFDRTFTFRSVGTSTVYQPLTGEAARQIIYSPPPSMPLPSATSQVDARQLSSLIAHLCPPPHTTLPPITSQKYRRDSPSTLSVQNSMMDGRALSINIH